MSKTLSAVFEFPSHTAEFEARIIVDACDAKLNSYTKVANKNFLAIVTGSRAAIDCLWSDLDYGPSLEVR